MQKIIKIIKGYKFVDDNLKSKNGDCTWAIGKWKKHDGELEICKSGLHASKTCQDVFNYIYGNRLFMVEARGKIMKDEDKFVASEMRLTKELDTKKLSVWFSIRCARRCLNNWTKIYPKDDRPLRAIEAAEKWLKEPTEENRSAAWSAAESAWSAWSAAWSAAKSAAWSAWSAAESAWSAAESAAWSAAKSAAWSAWSAAESAWSAESARSAEIKWQRKELEKLVKLYILNPKVKKVKA